MHTPEAADLRRQLTVLHLALCLGCAAFMGVAAYLWGSGTAPMAHRGPIPYLGQVALVLAVAAPLVAMALFRKGVRGEVAQATDPGAALRKACTLHWALIEGALILNLVVFLLHAEPLHWGVAAGLLLLLVLRAPSERRMQRWMTGTA
jgi:hypothetical protein